MPPQSSGGSVPFAAYVTRVEDTRLTGERSRHGKSMFPAITKVIDVVDDGLSRLEHIAEAHLDRRDARLCCPLVIRRQTVSLLADCELTGGSRTIPWRPE
jgi:hypothetical protein